MREKLQVYDGPNKFNYLCILANELLKEPDLTRLPVYCANFNSVLNTLPQQAVTAIKNLRLLGLAPFTVNEVKILVDQYLDYHRTMEAKRDSGAHLSPIFIPQRYEVGDDLRIRNSWSRIVPEDILRAADEITVTLPLREEARRREHNSFASAEIEREGGYSAVVQPMGFKPPEAPLYDTDTVGSAPGFASWEELIAVANHFDDIDLNAGRQQPGERSWYRRLHDAQGERTAILQQVGEAALEASDGIDLRDIKHLIGLPGSGKTTLIFLLAGWLSERNHKACFLFPSIQVSTNFIDTLSLYGIPVGLISGQGESSRNRHAMNFATSVSKKNYGFAASRPSARFFATTCALAGFASDEDENFPHEQPPCNELKQRQGKGSKLIRHRCALSSVCGYQFSERNLAEANIWAGHVLSIDRNVSSLYSNYKLRHFELIARTFDLVVIDEADGAQSALDSKGTPFLKLSGDYDSLWRTLNLELHDLAARGQNAFLGREGIPSIMEMSGRFGRATDRLLSRIIQSSREVRLAKANQLLTSLSIITDMFEVQRLKDEALERHYRCRDGFITLWDMAAKQVAFRSDIEEDDEAQKTAEQVISEAAELTGRPVGEIGAYYQRLLRRIELWDRDGSETALADLAAALKEAPGLETDVPDREFYDHAGLLISVTMVVFQHFGLAPHLRLLNSINLVSDSTGASQAARDLIGILPEALVGRLSGVRYSISDEGNVEVAQVGFTGAPRMLPHRMMELSREQGGSLAVLLTSATSLLEPSPSFHLQKRPDYVLKRPNSTSGWIDSRYKFLSLNDSISGEPLRFSGARLNQREYILTQMVEQLLRGGKFSHVWSAIQGNDVRDGFSRKAGLVVNSYEQCEMLYRYIETSHTFWRGKVRYLSQSVVSASNDKAALSAAEVESLSEDRDWEILIFPMNAIGRGVNIVFDFGPRQGQALIGSLFFLTRPHPRMDSMQLIQGMVGHRSEQFDLASFQDTKTAALTMRRARRDVSGIVDYLLKMSSMSYTIGKYGREFVADQMIIILQTIGRAMRGDCPAFVYFVDAAWAPNSARGNGDTAKSSMLVMMQEILEFCLSHPDQAIRECYKNLYESFAIPMQNVENLLLEDR